MIKNTRFKKLISIVLCIAFSTTSTAYARTAFPCAPNCNSDNMKIANSHHNGKHHHQQKNESPSDDTHTQHKSNASVLGTGYEDCEKCQNFYNGLFSFITVSDIVLNKALYTFTMYRFKHNSITHIPDAYQTPPA